MPVPRILIIHGSRYGQTAKIATRIAKVLEYEHFRASIKAAEEVREPIDLARYTGVIVGAPVLVSKHPRAARRFVITHRAALDKMPSAFFSVSGSAAGQELSQQANALRMLDEFLELTRWHPTRTASFAGAMAFTRYNFFVRWAMKRIAKKAGVSTDTSRDHEFTDWHAVERFAAEFAALVAPLVPMARRTPRAPLVFIA